MENNKKKSFFLHYLCIIHTFINKLFYINQLNKHLDYKCCLRNCITKILMAIKFPACHGTVKTSWQITSKLIASLY